MRRLFFSIVTNLGLVATALPATSQEIKGKVLEASEHNLSLTWQAAHVVVPASQMGKSQTGSAPWQGRLEEMPALAVKHRPLAIFMHGSSGISAVVKEYQLWLAQSLDLASIAPDSLAIPDRLTYKSPIGKDIYEQVHRLRLAELDYALKQARHFSWVDDKRIAILGASEGAVAIARSSDPLPAARILYGWSCEANYFVEIPGTAAPIDRPILTVIATRDPYFSAVNSWNANYTTTGSCAQALPAAL